MLESGGYYWYSYLKEFNNLKIKDILSKVSLLLLFIAISNSNIHAMDFIDYIPVAGGIKNRFLEGNSTRRSLAKRLTRIINIVGIAAFVPALNTSIVLLPATAGAIGPLLIMFTKLQLDKIKSGGSIQDTVEEEIYKFLKSQNDEFVNSANAGLDVFLTTCGNAGGNCIVPGAGGLVGAMGGFLF